MKRLLSGLFLLVFMAVNSHASSLIVFSRSDKELTDAIRLAIDKDLRDFTGPAPKHFIEHPEDIEHPEYAMLFSDEPFADSKFMQAKLDVDYPDLDLDVQTIPTTLWDMTIIKEWRKDPQNPLFTIEKTFTNQDLLKEARVNRYFYFSKKIGELLQGRNKSQETFKSLVKESLRQVASVKSGNTELNQAFEKEYEHAENGQSLVLKMVDEEYQAAKENQVLLIRGTNGLELYLDPHAVKPVDDMLKKATGELRESLLKRKAEFYEKNKDAWYSSETDKRKILDFPLHVAAVDAATYEMNTLKKKLGEEEPDFFSDTTRRISYGTSVMGGFLRDSFNRSLSACTFVFYARGHAKFVYTLLLDKKWLLGEGKDFFHFDKQNLYTDPLFGYGESFHPQIRSLQIAPLSIATLYNVISSGNVAYDDKLPDIPVAAKDEELKKDITIFTQYALKVAELLTHARIVFVGNKVLATANESEAAQSALSAQNDAYELFYNKVAG